MAANSGQRRCREIETYRVANLAGVSGSLTLLTCFRAAKSTSESIVVRKLNEGSSGRAISSRLERHWAYALMELEFPRDLLGCEFNNSDHRYGGKNGNFVPAVDFKRLWGR